MINTQPIKLTKSTFFDESATKELLVKFICDSSILSMGEQTKKFEELFAQKQARKYAVFVNSGSSANLIVLQALLNIGKIKKGARIGVSALTWATNVMPIFQLGLIPVALDCELDTLNVSSKILTESINTIDALFITNVLGFCDDLPKIKELCEDNDVLLLEDNCEALGSRINGTNLGNFGLASTFSFFVGHHMSTIEGGMVVTDDESLYYAFVMSRAHGWDRQLPSSVATSLRQEHKVEDFFGRYMFYDLAYNFRPTDIQGFIGTTQIGHWDAIVEKRQKNFFELMSVVRDNQKLCTSRVSHMDIVSNFAVPLVFKDAANFVRCRDFFIKNAVEIRPIIAGNITRQPFYKKYSTESRALVHSDHVHQNGFYFGNNPDLTQEEMNVLKNLLATI